MKNLIKSNFSANILISVICLFGFIAEAFFLNAILTHPASTQTNLESSTFINFLAIAAIPYLVLLIFSVLKNNIDQQNRKLLTACYLILVGVVFCLLALRQYGHTTPGFLFFGYFWQWLIIVWYLYKRYMKITAKL